jgi:hypothetical protein
MEYLIYTAAVLIAGYFAVRLVLRYYFPSDSQ